MKLSLEIGKRSDVCLNCGESEVAIIAGRKKHTPLLCCLVDSTENGSEVSDEFPRHEFVMTKRRKHDDEEYTKYLRRWS